MIRMTRMTDYGILLLTQFAKEPERPVRSARDLAAEAGLPAPMVSKVLKALARHGFLETRRGVRGGFTLARPAEGITVADVIGAMEGPIGVTECTSHVGGCDIERSCTLRTNWRRINQVVLEALKRITIAGMARPLMGSCSALELRVHQA